MRSLARTSLGLLGLALIAPSGVRAQDASASIPSGYQSYIANTPGAPAAASAPATAPAPTAYAAPVGLDGQPMPAPAAAEAPHKHKGRSICAKCAAKMQANNGMPPGTIVGCEHSKNGVCTACQAALNMPGQFVMAGGQPVAQPAEAPGRAVASSPSPAAAAASSAYAARIGQPGPSRAYDPSMAEPAPIGVVQANFSQAAGPMTMAPAGYAPQQQLGMSAAPGRAMVESAPGRDPYQAKSGPFPRPHIIGHLLGWSGLGAEKAEMKAWKKAEAHAMITYDENGKAPVEELPASMVFGKKR